MGKRHKKSGKNANLERIVLATATLKLIEVIMEIIKNLIE